MLLFYSFVVPIQISMNRRVVMQKPNQKIKQSFFITNFEIALPPRSILLVASLHIGYRCCAILVVFIVFFSLIVNRSPPVASPLNYDTVDTGLSVRDDPLRIGDLIKNQHLYGNQPTLDDFTNRIGVNRGSRSKQKQESQKKKKTSKNKSNNINRVTSEYASKSIVPMRVNTAVNNTNTNINNNYYHNQSEDNFVDLERMVELVLLEQKHNQLQITTPIMSIGHLNNIDSR